jgi:hypothetical protein
MSVFQDKRRHGKPWLYDFWLNGQRYQGDCVHADTCAPAKNRQEALDIQAERRKAAKQDQNLALSGVRREAYTLNQACVAYLARKQASSDYDDQIVMVREIRAFMNGHRAVVDFTPEDLEAYRKFCGAQTIKVWTGGPTRKRTGTDADNRFWKDTGRPRAPRTLNRYLKCLRAIFAIPTKLRDPVTRQPILDEVPEIKLIRTPKRIPRPIGDTELAARLETAPPWTRDAAELSRLFGLRHGEAFWVEPKHIYREAYVGEDGQPIEVVALRFGPGETKSGNEEIAHGGGDGAELLERLLRQAKERGVNLLVTWPGKKYFRAFLAGKEVPRDCWQGLKSVRRSWKAAARRAGIQDPHRFHDVRARYITEVAKVQPAAAQDAARHQDPSTTALYIKLASSEIRAAVATAISRRPKPRSGRAPAAKLKLVK